MTEETISGMSIAWSEVIFETITTRIAGGIPPVEAFSLLPQACHVYGEPSAQRRADAGNSS
jgi:hypothetical protein